VVLRLCFVAIFPSYAIFSIPGEFHLGNPIQVALNVKLVSPADHTLGCSLMGTSTRTDTLIGFSLVMSANVRFSSLEIRPVVCTRSNSETVTTRQLVFDKHKLTLNHLALI
jgi:hypothetical protein